MKRVLLLLAVVALAQLASAHVGSPNVFFEGKAGSYSVYAVVQPPAALPGAAQVSVRVRGDSETRSVKLLPVLWQAGREGSPSPVAAVRVAGETNLWSGEVWFLRPGSYTVRINVEGEREAGEAAVPVNVLGTANQQMKPGLSTTLLLFGLVLFASAVWIAGAMARECRLPPGEKPGRVDDARGRRVAAVATLMLAAGVAAGGARWRNMDLAYRTQGVQKPEPVTAEVREETNRVVLELRQMEQSVSQPSWAALAPDHGKLMHLFLVREPELNAFAHLHPIRQDAHRFALEVPPLPAGAYQLYGDVTFEDGIAQTLVARISLPKPIGPTFEPSTLGINFAGEALCGYTTGPITNGGPLSRDMDDSWHVVRGGLSTPTDGQREMPLPGGGLATRLMGGYTLAFENAAAVAAGRETTLRFAAFGPDGREASLQPYMGMLGHAAVRREDGSVFAHLHPMGSFSMASQEIFRQREAGANSNGTPPAPLTAALPAVPAPNRVSFPYQFPKPGRYRIWIQVRLEGRVLTGVYDLQIKLEK